MNITNVKHVANQIVNLIVNGTEYKQAFNTILVKYNFNERMYWNVRESVDRQLDQILN